MPEFGEIIDFAIEYDDGLAVCGSDWLVAGIEVDDLEPHCTKRDGRILESTLLVGTPVSDGFRDGSNTARLGMRAKVRKACNAAHPSSFAGKPEAVRMK